MGRLRRLSGLLAAGMAAIAVVTAARHRGAAMGRRVPGGILIGDVGAYDALSHSLLLGPLFTSIAADVAAAASAGARVLEVGCGPGHLAIMLAVRHGLDVTGLDLDPAMIERARANAALTTTSDARGPTFVVGDVAALPFADGSFDLVVSTLSMHHWTDPTAGLTEIGRVLRPDGRVLVWDFGRGSIPFHAHMPDPVEHARGAPLRMVSVTPWRWPWRLKLTHRIELVRDDGSPGYTES